MTNQHQQTTTRTIGTGCESRYRRRIYIGLAIVFCIGNLLGPVLFWTQSWSYGGYMARGALVGEIVLLGIWCGLGAQPRLPHCLIVLSAATGTFILGLQLASRGSIPIGLTIVVIFAASYLEHLAGTSLGDADLDGSVQFSDFLALSSNFDQPGGWAEGDFDGNGIVEFPDFLTLSVNFGASARAATAAVPEPTGLVLTMFGVLGVMRTRRRRRFVGTQS